jgi:hypothetical protein
MRAALAALLLAACVPAAQPSPEVEPFPLALYVQNDSGETVSNIAVFGELPDGTVVDDVIASTSEPLATGGETVLNIYGDCRMLRVFVDWELAGSVPGTEDWDVAHDLCASDRLIIPG